MALSSAVSLCWGGALQYFRCCVEVDSTCWIDTFLAREDGEVHPLHLDAVRCCREEPVLSVEHVAALEHWRRSGAWPDCGGRWQATRESLTLQHPLNKALKLAIKAAHDDTCFIGELTSAVVLLWSHAAAGGFKKVWKRRSRFLAFRLLFEYLPLWVSLLTEMEGVPAPGGLLSDATGGWPLLSALVLLRELAQDSGLSAEGVADAKADLSRRDVKEMLLAASASSRLEDPSKAPSHLELPESLRSWRQAISASGRIGGRSPFSGPSWTLEPWYEASATLTLALDRPTGFRKADQQFQRQAVSWAASLLLNASRASPPSTRSSDKDGIAASSSSSSSSAASLFLGLVAGSWPLLEQLRVLHDREPALLEPLRLLHIQRLEYRSSVTPPQPRPLAMRLLSDDGVSLAIRADGLPFCGGPFTLRWVRNLWQSLYSDQITIVEGGAEAGSCSLWMASMLQPSVQQRLRVVAIEPFPPSAAALQESIEANGWSNGTVEAVEVALVNRTQGANDELELMFAPGRMAEASGLHCVSAVGCSTIRVPALKLDDLVSRSTLLASSPQLLLGGGRYVVVHCLKLNVMSYEQLVLEGGAENFLKPPVDVDSALASEDGGPRILVCSVILDELLLDERKPHAEVDRVHAIFLLLRTYGFSVQAYRRFYGPDGRSRFVRLFSTDSSSDSIGKAFRDMLRSLKHEENLGDHQPRYAVALAAFRPLGVGEGACRAMEPPLRPRFIEADYVASGEEGNL